MLNMLFWMVMIFTVAVLIYNKWVRETEVRQMSASSEAGEVVSGYATPQMETNEPAIIFYDLQAPAKRVNARLELFTPDTGHVCEVYDLEGNRVA